MEHLLHRIEDWVIEHLWHRKNRTFPAPHGTTVKGH
jgi:hypothetical protein